jgi:sugar-specific transcriptional regulator TrmB
MSEQADTIINSLKDFSLTKDEAKIYLVLLENGRLSVLQISRLTNIGRTKVYRLLDSLLNKDLVTQEVGENGLKYVASEPGKLEQILDAKASRLIALKEGLPRLKSSLEQITGTGSGSSKIRYYKGQKGLDRVNFHILRAKKELLTFEVTNADAYLPHDRAEYLRQRLTEEKITIRTITNITEQKSFTSVKEMVRNYWQISYIDPKEFEIKADVFIYNQVYAMCHYLKKGDIFCLEIYNDQLAAMQKQIFEFLWNQAKPLTILNDQGKAKLSSNKLVKI